MLSGNSREGIIPWLIVKIAIIADYSIFRAMSAIEIARSSRDIMPGRAK